MLGDDREPVLDLAFLDERGGLAEDAGLLAGGTPLTVLVNVIDNYIAAAK